MTKTKDEFQKITHLSPSAKSLISTALIIKRFPLGLPAD